MDNNRENRKNPFVIKRWTSHNKKVTIRLAICAKGTQNISKTHIMPSDHHSLLTG
jgi:hypothetical protein